MNDNEQPRCMCCGSRYYSEREYPFCYFVVRACAPCFNLMTDDMMSSLQYMRASVLSAKYHACTTSGKVAESMEAAVKLHPSILDLRKWLCNYLAECKAKLGGKPCES